MLNVRKLVLTREQMLGELARTAERPVVRAVALAVIANPFVGRIAVDLGPLWEAGAELASA